MDKADSFDKKLDKYAEIGKKILVWLVTGVVVITVVGFALYSVWKIIFG